MVSNCFHIAVAIDFAIVMALWSSMVETTWYRRRCSAAVLHWWPKQRGSLVALIELLVIVLGT